jgi:hypothetical protein
VIHAEPRTIEWIQKTYDVEVEPDESYSPAMEERSLDEVEYAFSRNTDLGDTGYSVQDMGYLADLWKGKQPDNVKKALVIEYWQRVQLPRQIPQEDGSVLTVNEEFISRYTVLGITSKVLVGPEQMATPVTGFPFFAFRSHMRPGEFWGIGDVENLIPMQKEYNKRKTQIIEMFGLMSIGRMLLPIECDIDPDAVTNEQGEIIEYVATGGHMPTIMYPVQPPAAFFKHQEEIKKDIEAVSGIFEVTQGRIPTGIQAASAISQLQEAGQTKIRAKARRLEKSIRQLGRLLLEQFVTHYQATRFIRIIGPSGNPMIRPLDIPALLGPDGNLKFDILTETGLTMKMTRDEREKRALELYQAGVYDDVAVLEEIQYPRKGALLQRKYGAVGTIFSDKTMQFLLPFLQNYAQQLVQNAPAIEAVQQQQQMLAAPPGPGSQGPKPPLPSSGPSSSSTEAA